MPSQPLTLDALRAMFLAILRTLDREDVAAYAEANPDKLDALLAPVLAAVQAKQEAPVETPSSASLKVGWRAFNSHRNGEQITSQALTSTGWAWIGEPPPRGPDRHWAVHETLEVGTILRRWTSPFREGRKSGAASWEIREVIYDPTDGKVKSVPLKVLRHRDGSQTATRADGTALKIPKD